MTWGEDYVTLALRVEKHFEGFVDAYIGPQSLKNTIDKEEKQPLDTLFDQAEALLTIPVDHGPRKHYLEKQVIGIKTTIQVLQGEEIDYKTQVEKFFDIKPEKTPDSQLEKHKEVLQNIFKGKDLHTALEKWRKAREVPAKVLQDLIAVLRTECQKRTRNLLPLPEDEHVDFVLVSDKPWGGYNWYLGDYCSRVEINTDIPVRATDVPSLVAHESYPGHHTEHAIKEQVLYKGKGYTEACVFVYNTPECLISEGLASAGLDMIFETKKEAFALLKDKTGLNIDVETDAEISTALSELSVCSGNASLMIHQENCELEEAVQYLIDVGLSTRKIAEKQVEFMTNPLFRAYVFNYSMGKKIIADALKKVNPEPLYVNQVCPSNLTYFMSG